MKIKIPGHGPTSKKFWAMIALLFLLFTLLPSLALAEEAPVLNSGDTAWMLTATALVLFMTISGLSLFYAGMVGSKKHLVGTHAVFRYHITDDYIVGPLCL